ncbi:MAG: M13 family peptidase, partial [Janthinobacterium sp.]
MNRYLLSSLTLTLLAAFAHAAEPVSAAAAATVAPSVAPSAPAATGVVSGIDVQYIDPAVRVQDDFFTHLNGKWLATAEIPADKSSWGSFAKLRDDTTPQLRGIIEATQQDKNKKAGSEAQKIADLYASYMDEAKLESLGTKPLAGELNRIRSLRDKKGVPALIAHLSQTGVSTPYAVYVGQDARASTKYAAYVSQSGLGMPDR